MKKFESMPDATRVWIYQADRPLTPEEKQVFEMKATEFVNNWTSHSVLMDAAIELLHDRFAILAADESAAKASGCGIDKSVHFFQNIGSELGINFFSRMLVWYRNNQGEIVSDPVNVFWAKRKAGSVEAGTIVFDSLVNNLGELRSAWEIPFDQSWHQEAWSR